MFNPLIFLTSLAMGVGISQLAAHERESSNSSVLCGAAIKAI